MGNLCSGKHVQAGDSNVVQNKRANVYKKEGDSSMDRQEGLHPEKVTPVKSTLPSERKESQYIIGSLLGRGHFAEVRKCVKRGSNETFAVKIVDKEQLHDHSTVRREVEILRAVGEHPNVIALLDYFEDQHSFYLVMEYCAGGDLFSRITEEGPYSEKTAARCVLQLAHALRFIHSHGVIHRDLKPENIMLKDANPDAALKVGDFGLSKIIKTPEDQMKTICGTWAYCAPEVILRKPYGKEVDQWTLGVLMYILLSGYHPFDVYGDAPEPQLCRAIKACRYDFDDEVWKNVSKEALKLIRGLLQKDPKKRLSLNTVLRSKWVQQASDEPCARRLQRLRSFQKSRRHLRSLVLAKVVGARWRRKQLRRKLERQMEEEEQERFEEQPTTARSSLLVNRNL